MNACESDGGYPAYHYEVFQRLQHIGVQVTPASRPDALRDLAGNVDYVFSLFNRIPIRNSEVFVSSMCEFVRLPYLGAPPNARALAEDKLASKLVARASGIPVPRGVAYSCGISPTHVPPPFSGPYFIKERFGAASEGISASNIQNDWSGAREQIESLWARNEDALVEEFVGDIDLTLPVLGGPAPRVLGIFHPLSDEPGNILTHALKLYDHLGYVEVDIGPSRSVFEDDIVKLWDAIGPVDYFRVDYRWNPITGERRFLELNICCYFGSDGPFGLAARSAGLSLDRLLEHILAFSVSRQTRATPRKESAVFA